MKRIVSGIMLTILLIGMLAFNVQPVKASWTIYIRPDGSIDPPTAPILTLDNITYTLIEDIYIQFANSPLIVIERDAITFDGAGHTIIIQESGSGIPGILLSGRNNVTITNVISKTSTYAGLFLENSTNCRIVANNLTNSWGANLELSSSSNNIISGNNLPFAAQNLKIALRGSSNNSIIGNTMKGGRNGGILLEASSEYNIISQNIIDVEQYDACSIRSSNNTVSENQIEGGSGGAVVELSGSNNHFFGNDLKGSEYLFYFEEGVSGNVFYHNNFRNEAFGPYQRGFGANVWDDGYPSGGNFWSKYNGIDLFSGSYQNETGSDGIGDTPFTINATNRDLYPLMKPVATHDLGITSVKTSKTGVELGSRVYVNVTVVNYGTNTETFNTTAYTNASAIETKEMTLAIRDSTTITFAWNTSGFDKGRYIISAYVWPVPGETDETDNTYIDGKVTIKENTNIVFSVTPNPAYMGQTVTLQGSLRDENNHPLKNTEISVYSNGTLVVHLQTDSTGWFYGTGKPSSAGTYEITVSFHGSETHMPSNYTQTLTILPKINTKISFKLSPNPAKAGQTITLTGNLTDKYGKAIGNAPVEVYYSIDNGVTWVYTGTLQTNSAGWFKASGKLTIVGYYLIAVVYRGDFMYNLSYHIEIMTITFP